MPPDSGEFANFVNYWLELRRADGFRQQQFARGFYRSRVERPLNLMVGWP